MTDRERLEEIKKRTLISTSTFGDIEVIHIEYHDYDWLIEQAKRVQELKRFSISKDELKEVLNSNENIGELYQFVEGEHSIRDVFAIIVKEMGYLAGALGEYSESYFDLEQQNKRYREALKLIMRRTDYELYPDLIQIYTIAWKALEGEE